MWDQKSGTNVSLPEGNIQHNTSDPAQCHDKKIFESSSGQDSGFLSGPQNLYSSDIENISEELIIEEKPQNTTTILQDPSYCIDSGLIVDQEEGDSSIAPSKEETKDSQMILDSGLDLNLPEWFCGLNIKDGTTPLNNLGCNNQKSSATTSVIDLLKYPKLAKKLQQRPFWEICYIQDDEGDTQLHLAIICKYVQAVWGIIRLAPVPAALDIRNDDALAPIHLAVLTRQPSIVRRLVVAGAKTSVRDRNGNTPLHLACINSDKACVEALTLPVTSEELYEVYKHKERIPQVHHQLPADLEQRNYDGEHCVHIVAQKNDVDILRHLVQSGADINAREGKSGYTALHIACENGNVDLIQFLLNECTKLNVECGTYGQWTAYQLASRCQNIEIMSELERYGADLLTPPTSDDDDDYSDSYDEEDF